MLRNVSCLSKPLKRLQEKKYLPESDWLKYLIPLSQQITE